MINIIFHYLPLHLESAYWEAKLNCNVLTNVYTKEKSCVVTSQDSALCTGCLKMMPMYEFHNMWKTAICAMLNTFFLLWFDYKQESQFREKLSTYLFDDWLTDCYDNSLSTAKNCYLKWNSCC